MSTADHKLERLRELSALISEAQQQVDKLQPTAVAEKLEGVPSRPGSRQAQYDAALVHLNRLMFEQQATYFHWSERRISRVAQWRGLGAVQRAALRAAGPVGKTKFLVQM